MPYFVTVTFDLRYADTSIYPKIQRELESLDFSKIITGNKNIEKGLPANTFAARFDNSEFDLPSELRDYVSDELKNIFKRFSLKGKFFVCAGKNWAWKHKDFDY